MNAYRDQYATLFDDGRGVVLIAISADPDTALASWARDSEFPFLFASDSGRAVARRYGAQGSRNLFVVVILSGVYSFLMATVLTAMDAVDVAMTEASVGAGISTVLLLGALFLCKSDEARPLHKRWPALAVSLAMGAVLVYGTIGLP